MKIQLLTNLQKNLVFFETDMFLLGKIRGCTEAELQKMDKFYNYKIPQVIRELFFLGGHNFFDFYFQLEYSTGYRLWQQLLRHDPNQEEVFLSVSYQYIRPFEKKQIYLVDCAGILLFVPLNKGANPPIYELFAPTKEQPTVCRKYNSVCELVDIIVESQRKSYAAYQERLKWGIDEFTKENERMKAFRESDEYPLLLGYTNPVNDICQTNDDLPF
jgi:hypothetical protein